MSWRPGADREALEARARLLQGIRAFFLARDVLEVETPLLSRAGNTDPAIESFRVCDGGYLHTSPEFPMKRLLAAGSGDIYQICKVFRRGEAGRYHNPEFTLLEWYRLGFDDRRLANEVVELIGTLAARPLPVQHIGYQRLFTETLGIDPLSAELPALEAAARIADVHPGCEMPRDDWLDLLLSHCITPDFPADRLTIVTDYPASQAALARLRDDGRTAARFEVYWGSLELANGYHELTDAQEQRCRVAAEQAERRQRGLPPVPADEYFLVALDAGLPDCAGVALGVDRLLMKLIGAAHIGEVIAFTRSA